MKEFLIDAFCIVMLVITMLELFLVKTHALRKRWKRWKK